MGADSKSILKAGNLSPQLGLLRRMPAAGESTRNDTCFKAIGKAANVDELNIPSMIKGYNGKPALISTSAIFDTTMLPRVMEIDYDLRGWSYFARQSIGQVLELLPSAQFQVAYLIEGKKEDELPEQILGCGQLHEVDLRKGVPVTVPSTPERGTE